MPKVNFCTEIKVTELTTPVYPSYALWEMCSTQELRRYGNLDHSEVSLECFMRAFA